MFFNKKKKTDGMDAPSRYGIVVPEWKLETSNSRKEGGPL